jgi:hypothetical protein
VKVKDNESLNVMPFFEGPKINLVNLISCHS